ncbi:MAG: PD40 domain-containing protein [Gemmatimonadetes bacterium]|nr:PD40 domain-containing protein [Gemmatimonadota bacterium]
MASFAPVPSLRGRRPCRASPACASPSPAHSFCWPLASPVAAQSGAANTPNARALRVEDFYRLKSVGAPALSPDGRWVAFALTTRLEATNAEPSEVWLVPADASAPARRVSPEGSHATAPAWSADGQLQYVADNKGWRLDPAAPAQVTEYERPPSRRNGAGGGELTLPAPNGAVTASLRNVPPAPRARATLTDFEQRHEARFKGVQFDWLDFQRDGQPFPVPNSVDPAVSPPQEIFLTRNGSEQQLTRLAVRPQGLQWNRDATRLIFTADSAYRDERRYGASAVYTVATDGAVRRLTPDTDYQHTSASFSPDGRWVLYTKQLSTNAVIARKLDHGGATDLYSRPGRRRRRAQTLTADWDYLPSNAMWSPDGRYVYFVGGVGGGNHLFRVAAAGGAVEQVTRGERRINNLTVDGASAPSPTPWGSSRPPPTCTWPTSMAATSAA